MTLIRKDTPGSAPGGLEWEAGDIVDVPRELAADLLRIQDADFHEVAADPDSDKRHDLPKKKAELQAIAHDLGIDDSGTVAELTARIKAHQAEAKTPIEEGAQGDDSDGADEPGASE